MYSKASPQSLTTPERRFYIGINTVLKDLHLEALAAAAVLQAHSALPASGPFTLALVEIGALIGGACRLQLSSVCGPTLLNASTNPFFTCLGSSATPAYTKMSHIDHPLFAPDCNSIHTNVMGVPCNIWIGRWR